MSKQRRAYARREPVPEIIDTRGLGNRCRCSLLKTSDGYYQVLLINRRGEVYLVDDPSQYDPRTIEDAFGKIRSTKDFGREREKLILDQEQMIEGDGEGDLEGMAEFEEETSVDSVLFDAESDPEFDSGSFSYYD